jgi:hypothetical protein
MRTREKLTLEEKFALALELIKRARSLDEIRLHYRVSHTTAYKIRNTFLEGGRTALSGERKARQNEDLEARVRALESLFDNVGEDGRRTRRPLARIKRAPLDSEGLVLEQRAGK